MPILENSKCKNMFKKAGRVEFIPDIFLCAGYEKGGTDACQVRHDNLQLRHISNITCWVRKVLLRISFSIIYRMNVTPGCPVVYAVASLENILS